MRLLIVEDEVKTADTLKKGLEEKGYSVETTYDGESALKIIKKQNFDLIITDIIMPKVNGIEFCEKLRQIDKQTPVIMITALGLTTDKIKGFDAGTDDYLVKPFDFDELLVRIRVLINRTKAKQDPILITYSDLVLNQDSREVIRNGERIDLTAKEFSLLLYFLKNINRIISKEELADQVWGIDFDTGTNVIEVYVSYLRNKIDKDFKQKLIHTRKGMGYVMRAD